MTDRFDVSGDLAAMLAAGPLFTVAEIAGEARVSVEVLKSWLARGRLKLDHRKDEISAGGRSKANRLHWRSVIALLVAVKLNEYGFGLINGEAVEVARRVAGDLAVSDLQSTTGRLVLIRRVLVDGRRSISVGTVARAEIADAVQAPVIVDRFAGVGSLVVDPIGLGAVIWRMIRRQAEEALADAV